jgi:hypothetical protein
MRKLRFRSARQARDALRRRLLRQRTFALVAGLRGSIEQARRDPGAVEQNGDLPGYSEAVVAVYAGSGARSHHRRDCGERSLPSSTCVHISI